MIPKNTEITKSVSSWIELPQALSEVLKDVNGKSTARILTMELVMSDFNSLDENVAWQDGYVPRSYSYAAFTTYCRIMKTNDGWIVKAKRTYSHVKPYGLSWGRYNGNKI